MLFEVAILEAAKKKDGKERLAMKPTYVIAKDSQSAAISAVMDNKDLKVDKQRMVVLVRPFA